MTNPTINSNYLFDDKSIAIGWYPCGEELEQILLANYNVFVSLVTTEERSLLGEYYSRVHKIASSNIFLSYSITDNSIPDEMENFKLLIKTILSLKNLGYKIYIHCRGGHGRSGIVAACLLKELGVSSENALAEVQKWHNTRENLPFYPSPSTNEQREFVKKYEIDREIL